MATPQKCRWHPLEDQAALDVALAQAILTAAERALRARRQFHLVLAGGNTPRGAYRRLSEAKAGGPEWQIYFGDERCLPSADPERNSWMANGTWLDHVGIHKANVHAIPAELGAARAAAAYTATLRPIETFDLVLLGLGEDGHTASLFPGHDWGATTDAPDVLPVLDAPKPPPERVTLSARRLSWAREIVFVVGGEGKHRAVAAWRAGAAIPASAITPEAGVDILVEASLLKPLAD
jgi:6-phosphogluconolactonase